MKYFYKIRNTKTGHYKTAGTWGFSLSGKVWKNIAALMGHFAMYGRNRERLLEKTQDWVVEMYSTEPVETKSVADFLKERWEKK
jgi:hypothetical protein